MEDHGGLTRTVGFIIQIKPYFKNPDAYFIRFLNFKDIFHWKFFDQTCPSLVKMQLKNFMISKNDDLLLKVYSIWDDLSLSFTEQKQIRYRKLFG